MNRRGALAGLLAFVLLASLVVLALLCTGCSEDHGRVDPLDPKYSCGVTCFDCAGSGPPVYHPSLNAPVDCAVTSREVLSGDLCWVGWGDNPEATKGGACFYGCAGSATCATPEP